MRGRGLVVDEWGSGPVGGLGLGVVGRCSVGRSSRWGSVWVSFDHGVVGPGGVVVVACLVMPGSPGLVGRGRDVG